MDPETTVDTDARTTEQIAAATDDTDVGDGTYVPPLLLVVFGLPIFLVLIWFFLRFTAPDRFGRVDRSFVDDIDDDDLEPEDPPQDPSDRPA